MSFALGAFVLIGIYGLSGFGAAWCKARLALTSIAHASILGSGAYAIALASGGQGASAWVCLLSLLVGTTAGALSVLVSARVVGDDFALVTFALQVLWLAGVGNLDFLTGGVLGISGIQPLWQIATLSVPGVYVGLIVVIATIWILVLRKTVNPNFLVSSLVVARSAELANSLGLSALSIRLQVGAIYGSIVGGCGILLATYLSFIGPEQFSVGTSVVILAVAIVSRGSLILAFLGAFGIIGFPELLRLIGLPSSQAGSLQLMLSGLLVGMSGLLLGDTDAEA